MVDKSFIVFSRVQKWSATETPINFKLHWSDLLYDISRLKYMFIMYIYVTGVLDKVPNTIFFLQKQNKKMGLVEDHHTRYRGPTVHCFTDK